MAIRILLITLIFAVLLSTDLHASVSNDIITDHARSRFVTEFDQASPGKTVWVAFQQELATGWHVYWENPGDSGLPLDIRWTLPEGVSAGDVVYPIPERIPVGPLANYGHHDAPVFLVPLKINQEFEPGEYQLEAAATWLICEEICVPEEGHFAFTLHVADEYKIDPTSISLFKEARRALASSFPGDAVFQQTPDGILLELTFDEIDAEHFAAAYFFPLENGLVEPSAPQFVEVADDKITFLMKPGFGFSGDQLTNIEGVVASADKGAKAAFSVKAVKSTNALKAPENASFAIDETAAGNESPISQISSGDRASKNVGSVALLLLGALVGGAFLNLMPCVFPIVFIKATTLMNAAQCQEANKKRDGLLFMAGVLTAFAILGGFLLLLRAGGAELGWGFHLQSPVVVLISAYILFAVGLNLFGFFEIGESLQKCGNAASPKQGPWGSYFTGVLAVLVAAPCVGPFLGAPLAAAVLLPPLIGFLIFIAMALGFAAPYVALSFSPGLGKLLPKPGSWMLVLKQALAFPVFAAAAFFLWVLVQQAGEKGLSVALAGALLLAIAAWLFQHSKQEGGKSFVIRIVSVLILACSVGLALSVKAESVVSNADDVDGRRYGAFSDVRSFSPDLVEEIRAGGRGVFVDFTAAWCVTCQFNKITIFSKASVRDAFDASNVALLVADWTLRDPEITKNLQQFGANGVPLYVYYPATGAPIVMSTPLTEKQLLNEIRL